MILSLDGDETSLKLDSNECRTMIRKIVQLGSDSSDEEDDSIAAIPIPDRSLKILGPAHGALTATPDQAA